MRSRRPSLVLICSLLLAGCAPHSPPGFTEQEVPVSPETLKPYAALFAVDRQKIGFPPLPTNGTVRILTVDRAGWKQGYPPPNYDVSLQFCSGTSFYPYTSRFVALKSTNGGFTVVSEQMSFNGPKRHQESETMVNEYISIVNETEQVAFTGTNIVGTVISYRGPDPRLGDGRNGAEDLTPAKIGPVLREWGYDYRVDKARAD
jgi:hypothetical protein